MEITIPPRDHGASTFRYTWDENGEVTQINRVAKQPQPQPPPMAKRSRYGRQTVQWPFQSVATIETAISSQLLDHPFMPLPTRTTRRATWEPKRMLPPLRRDSGSDADTDLVPDYVINYIRGETPETVARRKNNGGKLGERGVDVVTHHKPHQSRAAVFEGFYDDESSTTRHEASLERLSGWDDDAEDSHILSGDGDGGGPKSRTPGWRRPKGWRRFAVGWRGGVALNLLLTCLIMVIGIVCLILAVSKGSPSAGEAVIYTGSCSTADGVNWGFHAVVSVFAVVLLAGANYAFQVLSSPTRKEVDAAHLRSRWLDIGVPSIRNFAYIGKSRGALFAGILVVTLATQVIYNAVIFTSRTAPDLNLVYVTHSFLTGAPFSNGTSNNEAKMSRLDILSLQDLAGRKALVNMTGPDCVAQFTRDLSSIFQADYEAVLFVTNTDPPTSSLIQTAKATSGSGLLPVETNPASIDYCLVQEATSPLTCTVNLHTSLVGVATLLNLVKIIVLAIILFRPNFKPLVSLGDALASFLQRPDSTTTRSCLLTKSDISKKTWDVGQAKYWIPSNNHFWFKTPSLAGWIIFLWSWTIVTAPAVAVLVIIFKRSSGLLSTFGKTSPETLLGNVGASPLQVAVEACLPQILLVFLYLATNSLMTTYYLSHEASQFALGRPRPLRVTSAPEGSQVTSLYLTLPRPWSWFLVLLFIGLSFVLSQSVFLVSTHVPSSTNPDYRLTVIAFSGTSLVILISLLALLLLTILGLGFRRAEPAVLANGQAVGNPLALKGGSCSAVFSAWCHPSPDNRESDVWMREVTWGVVSERGGSHCTFTAGKAGQLGMARSYY